jgi:CRP-like cAMP-binding protein
MPLDADTLRRVPAFASLSNEACAALGLCFRGRKYAAGETVFREGEPGASMLLCASGELSAAARAGSGSRRIGRVGPGQLVGEAALLDPAPRTATLTAVRPSEVWEIGDDAIEILRRASPAAARALTAAAIGGVVRRLRQLEQRIERELDRVGALP